MKRVLLVGLSLLFSVATAQDETSAQVAAMTDASMALVQLSSFVDTNVAFCAQHAPEAGVSEAAATWYAASSLTLLKTLEALPEVAATFGEMRDAYTQATQQTLTANATGREAEWCASLPALLESPEWDVQTNYPDELARLGDIFSLVTGDDPPTPLPRVQTLPPMTSPSYAAVVAAGVDPEKTFIQDEFHCYDEASPSYSRPSLAVQVTGPGRYESSYGGGSYTLEEDDYAPDITWTSGPLKDARGSLFYNDYGQRFELGDVTLGDESYDFGCYQQGSSDQQALTAFRLKDPQPGTHTCRDAATGEAQALDLVPGGQYTIGGASGTYNVSGIVNSDNGSQINWLTGPFAEQSSYYSEEADNGFRSFDLSLSDGRAVGTFVYSSSELSLSCEGLGKPVSFQKYGEAAAPPTPPTEVALDGFFYRLEVELRGNYTALVPHFYRFFPSGYVYTDTPDGDPAGIDCNRTLPNGAPFCDTYQIKNNLIALAGSDPEPFSLDGATPVLSGEAFSPVEISPLTSLDGLFWAN